jgi:hypothetical protein
VSKDDTKLMAKIATKVSGLDMRTQRKYAGLALKVMKYPMPVQKEWLWAPSGVLLSL